MAITKRLTIILHVTYKLTTNIKKITIF